MKHTLAAIACAFALAGARAAPGPLPHEVYVWQRAWNEPVLDALRERATNFSGLVCLAAEVTWSDGRPRTVRVPVNWQALRAAGPPVGLALRIGPFGGPFDGADERGKALTTLAQSLVAEASRHSLTLSELQIDFDCAESKLEGYAAWVAAIRRQVAPTRVVITVLPAWLKRPAFPALARAAHEFVLQVHSLERPTNPDAAFTLCDPDLARQAVARAGQIGVLFRVALPTYGYLVAFDSKGAFAGLSAEGPRRNWPAGAQLREVRADPAALARLVRDWTRERPQTLRGIIWYRLPVEGDTLNWAWPTLAKVMAGETPQPRLRAFARRAQPGLFEFELVNEGEADYAGDPEIHARWTGPEPLASDGLRGFEPRQAGPRELRLRSRQPVRLQPQERRMAGWLRLAADAEVEVRISGTHPNDHP